MSGPWSRRRRSARSSTRPSPSPKSPAPTKPSRTPPTSARSSSQPDHPQRAQQPSRSADPPDSRRRQVGGEPLRVGRDKLDDVEPRAFGLADEEVALAEHLGHDL